VIRVEDLGGVLSEAEAAGGAVVQGPTEIPEIGMVYAVFRDTEGNILNVVGDLAE
jgi:predicted enzyme related to lactoylglutathione lyase